jgi:hypothetical protein
MSTSKASEQESLVSRTSTAHEQKPQSTTQPSPTHPQMSKNQPLAHVETPFPIRDEGFWSSEQSVEIIKYIVIFVLFIIIYETYSSYTKYVPPTSQQIVDKFVQNNPEIVFGGN